MNDNIYSEEQIISLNKAKFAIFIFACILGMVGNASAKSPGQLASPKSVTLGPPPEHFLFKTDLGIQDMARCGATVQSVATGDTVRFTFGWSWPIICEWYREGKQLPFRLNNNDTMVYQPAGWPGWTVNYVIPNAQPADAGSYSVRFVVGTSWVTNNFRLYVGSPLHIEMLWISDGIPGITVPNMGLLLVGDPAHPAPRYTIQYTTDLVNWFQVFDVTPALTYPPTYGNGPTGQNGPSGAWVSSGSNTAIIWLRYWGGNRWFRAVPQPF